MILGLVRWLRENAHVFIYALGLLTGLGLLWLTGWTWLGSARVCGALPKVASLGLLVFFLWRWQRAWGRV